MRNNYEYYLEVFRNYDFDEIVSLKGFSADDIEVINRFLDRFCLVKFEGCYGFNIVKLVVEDV